MNIKEINNILQKYIPPYLQRLLNKRREDIFENIKDIPLGEFEIIEPRPTDDECEKSNMGGGEDLGAHIPRVKGNKGNKAALLEYFGGQLYKDIIVPFKKKQEFKLV